MATTFVAPETTPLHLRILSRSRPQLASIITSVEAFHIEAQNASQNHAITARSSQLLPSTAFQLVQLSAAIAWEQTARPSSAPLYLAEKHTHRNRTSADTTTAAAAGSLASTPSKLKVEKKKSKKAGSKWA
ncbi:hypothetical protein BASA50_000718 [Batrachochytrium salamandrivorans]|uniref:Uncharacterized protein n=1 Tax=Batrachochytrium salamandrivorans TaxID=1357716 RepID=A0ABQ8ETC3_9FUNG|nr:hypothetical protein BASA60_004825 [Batrachochytrium salamandrivorans]KAH6576800.1 hypothetical protein BASA62_001251 [Batrachochytrium salamandrivorans]KAH6585206.1 hypothetical protein BASA61_006999 [Batrachochytrium salamandrivorans]KAH6586254.1 hypothetical protein BASA50_000718 [Batrachochytrium salamandrivorans]KAH9254940.1 hypothetical protein BASA81_007007 [Batrachochytrium salamandrivorans]